MRLINMLANINLRKDLCEDKFDSLSFYTINVIDDIISKWYGKFEIIDYKHALKHENKIKYLCNKNIWEFINEN